MSHPEWCRCRSCEAQDRVQERAALRGVFDDPTVAAEFEGVVFRPGEPCDLTDKSQRLTHEMLLYDDPPYSLR